MPDRTTTTARRPQSPYRTALAALSGTSIEWYDFYAFATAAAIVFNDVFFPADMPTALKTISSFATFAVGFLCARSAASCSGTSVTASAVRRRWSSPS